MSGGNLFERLSDPMYKLTESKCQVFIKQILEGLEFIHNHRIVHLNILPYSIIFLNKVGDGWSTFCHCLFYLIFEMSAKVSMK